MTDFDADGLAHLLTWVQSGVVARWQLVDLHARDHDVRRMVRRGELHVHVAGIYIDHNGPLSWQQRAWVAVLHYWPASLDRESALPDPDPDAPIQVVVDLHRRIRPMRGVVVRATADRVSRTQPLSAPPRLTIEDATLNRALAAPDVPSRFAAMAEGVGTRRATAATLADALARRGRVPRRSEVAELLGDLASGANSVLEREWLRLERAHALPVGRRQVAERAGGRSVERDVRYVDEQVLVELDGRAGHTGDRARDRDADRDLDAAAELGDLTLRLTYRLVFDRGCDTARRVSEVLARRGWSGTFRRCPDCP